MNPMIAQPRLAAWCGWTLAGVFLLAPLLGWLGPLGFAPVVGLAGLLCLPAFRVRDEDRPAAIAVLVMVVWACGSTVWSPYVSPSLEKSTAAKLVAEMVLFGSAIAAGRTASPLSRRWMLRFMAYGMALLALLLLIEAATGAGLYRALRVAMHDPIRPDLAIKNVAQGLFVLALFAPAAIVAPNRTAGGVVVGLLVVAG